MRSVMKFMKSFPCGGCGAEYTDPHEAQECPCHLTQHCLWCGEVAEVMPFCSDECRRSAEDKQRTDTERPDHWKFRRR